MIPMYEKTTKSVRKYTGRIVSVDLLEVRLADGRKAVREIVRHGGAIAALCRLKDGRFVFVEQFRKPAEKTILEVVAGGLEQGERPLECAKREVREETGYLVDKAERMGAIYLAPGYSTEKIHIYFCSLHGKKGRTDPDEDEVLNVKYLNRNQIEKLIAAGRIEDSKTLAAWAMYNARIKDA